MPPTAPPTPPYEFPADEVIAPVLTAPVAVNTMFPALLAVWPPSDLVPPLAVMAATVMLALLLRVTLPAWPAVFVPDPSAPDVSIAVLTVKSPAVDTRLTSPPRVLTPLFVVAVVERAALTNTLAPVTLTVPDLVLFATALAPARTLMLPERETAPAVDVTETVPPSSPATVGAELPRALRLLPTVMAPAAFNVIVPPSAADVALADTLVEFKMMPPEVAVKLMDPGTLAAAPPLLESMVVVAALRIFAPLTEMAPPRVAKLALIFTSPKPVAA